MIDVSRWDKLQAECVGETKHKLAKAGAKVSDGPLPGSLIGERRSIQ